MDGSTIVCPLCRGTGYQPRTTTAVSVQHLCEQCGGSKTVHVVETPDATEEP